MCWFIYPSKSSAVVREKLTLSCASAVLLTLISFPHASAQAQSLPSPKLEQSLQEKGQALKNDPEKEIKQTEQKVEQPLPLQKATPQTIPTNPITTVPDKYQKLLDAEVFSSSSTPANLDAMMTRAEFAAVIAKLQTLNPQLGSASFSFSDSALSPDVYQAFIAAAGTAGVISSDINAETLFAVNGVVAEIVPIFQGGATGMSSEALAALSLALSAAAEASSMAASSLANNIALANATNLGANYTVTPLSNWPANLNATYNGRLSGELSDSSAVGGNLTMNVNFATIRSAAAIPGSVLFDNGKGSASLNLVQFNGFVGGGMNGTYNGQAMTGFIRNGQFYGPAAEAIKGSWDMSTSSVSGGGTFTANR